MWLALLCAAVQKPAAHVLARREPCTTSVDAFKAKDASIPELLQQCQQELAELSEQLGECEAEQRLVEEAGDAQRNATREAWQAANDDVAVLQAKVAEKEEELAALEAANDQLHADLVEALQGRGLALLGVKLDLKAQEEPEGALVDAWLQCEDDKTSKQLKFSACETSLESAKNRHVVSNSHYDSLKDSAEHNVEMLQSRLDIIEQMIQSAEVRKERLTQQVADLNEALGDYTALLAVRSNGTNATRTANETAARAAPAAAPATVVAGKAETHVAAAALRGKADAAQAAQAADAAQADPKDVARAELAKIDAQITVKSEEVQRAIETSAQARVHMEESVEAQRELKAELEPIKKATLEAFVKAFQLDYRLDRAEEMHDDAYVRAKNSTRLFEQAAEAHHEAVAELQRLLNRKRVLQHVIAGGPGAAQAAELVKEDAAPKSASRRVGLQLVLALALGRAAF